VDVDGVRKAFLEALRDHTHWVWDDLYFGNPRTKQVGIIEVMYRHLPPDEEGLPVWGCCQQCREVRKKELKRREKEQERGATEDWEKKLLERRRQGRRRMKRAARANRKL
jgi:hypothetical protein